MIEQIDDRARRLAKEVYEGSKHALMAHSVRAVQDRLRQVYRKPRYSIVVELGEVQNRYSRRSWVVFGPSFAMIFVDASLDHDDARVCIAHELFHILYSVDKDADNPQRQRGKLWEDACDVFANTLCDLHDVFYSDPSVIETHCRFHNLPVYSTQIGPRATPGLATDS